MGTQDNKGYGSGGCFTALLCALVLASAVTIGCSGSSSGGGSQPSAAATIGEGQSDSPHPHGPSPSPAPTPTPVPSPLATATATPAVPPAHVLTWIEADQGTPAPSPAAYAPYVSWYINLSGNPGAAAIRAAGIKDAFYTDPNHDIPGGGEYLDKLFTRADDATTCSGALVLWNKHPGQTVYLTDPRKPDVVVQWRAAVAHVGADGQYDAVFEDTSGQPTGYDQPGPPCGTPPNAVSQTDWIAATMAQEAALGHPIIFNGLAPSGKGAAPQVAQLAGSVQGGLSEVCFESYATGYPLAGGARWYGEQVAELAAQAAGHQFWCHNQDITDGSTAAAIQKRVYIYASWLLTYDLGSSVFGEHWSVGASNVRVQPESQLVPYAPLVKTPADVRSLLAADGNYHRTYLHCYLAGVDKGVCDVAVNPDPNAAHTLHVPFTSTHELQLAGSGTLDGGIAGLGSSTPPPTLARLTARISFP